MNEQPEAVAPAFPSPAVVLRALREARGVSQEGWAALLGVGRKTVQRWESGLAIPDPHAEEALLALCRERGLLRAYGQGPLAGLTVTTTALRALLADRRTVKPARVHQEPPATPAPGAWLVTLAGERRSYPLAAVTSIGRDPANDIVLAASRVSRRHARITAAAAGMVLEDLGSKNGTAVNGQPVVTPHPLAEGDAILLGGAQGVALQFTCAGHTETAPAASLPGQGLWVDAVTGEIWLRRRRVILEPQATRALMCLYEQADKVVERRALAERIWPRAPWQEASAALDRLVVTLRDRLERDPARPRLVLDDGEGYRLALGQDG